jgi:hypothetical protein
VTEQQPDRGLKEVDGVVTGSLQPPDPCKHVGFLQIHLDA